MPAEEEVEGEGRRSKDCTAPGARASPWAESLRREGGDWTRRGTPGHLQCNKRAFPPLQTRQTHPHPIQPAPLIPTAGPINPIPPVALKRPGSPAGLPSLPHLREHLQRHTLGLVQFSQWPPSFPFLGATAAASAAPPQGHGTPGAPAAAAAAARHRLQL